MLLVAACGIFFFFLVAQGISFACGHGNSWLWHVGSSSPLFFRHSVVSDSAIPWTSAHQASLSFTISWSPVKLMPSESALRYWSFSINPSKAYSWLSSSRINWFDLLVVQGTLKSLLQHHSLKASILRCSAFFIVQFSHLYMTTGKIIALTIRTFVSKVISLLFNTLSRVFFKNYFSWRIISLQYCGSFCHT